MAPREMLSAGCWRALRPEPFNPRSPAPEPRNYSNNSNGVPSYFAGAVGGTSKGTGTIKSERSLIHNTASPFFTGPLRSPQRLQNTFAHECFMDELASRVKADPVEYRLRHLSDSRLSDVVKAAAKAANWDARPSPKAGDSQDRRRHGPRHRLRGLRGRQRICRHGRRGRKSIRTAERSP